MNFSTAQNNDSQTTQSGFWNFRTVNPARSLLCYALGTAIGLGLAGFGLFTAKGTVTHVVPPENVALINQRPILRTDFIAQTETEYGRPFGETAMTERLKILNDMIREELFVQRGLELDMPGTDPDTRSALVNAVEQQVIADVTTYQPTDTELRKFFEDHRSNYANEGTMIVHNFVIPKAEKSFDEAMADADKAIAALRNGTSIADLQKKYDLHELISENAGEEQFYFAQKIHLGEALFERALTLNDGEISGPLAADDGVHLIQMVKNTMPKALTFESARGQVLSDYSTAAKQRLENADERYLRDKADILIADDYAGLYQRDWLNKDEPPANSPAVEKSVGTP